MVEVREVDAAKGCRGEEDSGDIEWRRKVEEAREGDVGEWGMWSRRRMEELRPAGRMGGLTGWMAGDVRTERKDEGGGGWQDALVGAECIDDAMMRSERGKKTKGMMVQVRVALVRWR